jgi:hypothetical protein
MRNCFYCEQYPDGTNQWDCPNHPRHMYELSRVGWLCPRCQKVHAPEVEACDCNPQPQAKGQVV